MTCKSCGCPATGTKGPAHERICWPCANMLVGAKFMAELLYGRPFFWDGKSPVQEEDFLNATTARAWSKRHVRFGSLVQMVQSVHRIAEKG